MPATTASAEILVVHPDPAAERLLVDRLHALGHTVCATLTAGREAVEEPADLRPDLALIDLGSNGGGIEAAESCAAVSTYRWCTWSVTWTPTCCSGRARPTRRGMHWSQSRSAARSDYRRPQSPPTGADAPAAGRSGRRPAIWSRWSPRSAAERTSWKC